MTNRPDWWNWELELSPHLLKRMIDRGFSPSGDDGDRVGFRDDAGQGRWIVETNHDFRSWQVIVEPDTVDKLSVVITAFPADKP